ncbi:MAG: glycine cleavage system protein H, partial [bacterium]
PLFSPVSGKVVEVNATLNDAPQTVNESAEDKAWLIKIELTNPAEADSLLSAEGYNKLISS